MKRWIPATIAFLCATLTACATMFPPDVAVGESESSVIAKRGEPTHRYQDGNQRLLEYATGPWGQKTWMARIGPDGKVVSFEQVLTSQKFGTLQVGTATKDDVLRTVGAPSETSYLNLSDLEVWTYPYKESNVWNSLMHIHFDKSGVVRKLMNGPDPRFDPDLRVPMGMPRR
ncbi:outer membrane protein assembly factor BamE domain-containing protein [Noviherbaspirillum galbum]|uniref:Outer membrane protein assembly factor BamE n=1 Tax=Noviherbaspirillum galbum TaxID=2709383 RepID=A0A6B3SSN3_9BURK|nr:outer membrane protein assembly factor BamE [Noviherbaspirillum galbum]NEX61836.1 outer membrane protein assembly factor BamE [Noviherbaspirillum galbum]